MILRVLYNVRDARATTINLINLIYFKLLCEFYANELSAKRHILTS